jgi:uncharacterized protein YceH (UPF0502 family)
VGRKAKAVTELQRVTRRLAAHNDMVELRKSARQLAAERSAEEVRQLLREWRRRQRGKAQG